MLCWSPTASPYYGLDDGGKDTHCSESPVHKKPTGDHENGHKEMAQGIEIELPDLVAPSEKEHRDSNIAANPSSRDGDGAQEASDQALAELQGEEDADACTETEDTSGCGCACASFCRKMFPKAPEPLLPRPASPPVVKKKISRARARGCSRTLAPTRSSLCQAARPSSVSVAQRAQLKLMRELDFINGDPSAPNAAITEYLDNFRQDLPDKAIKALRTATKLNKELCKALADFAAGLGTDKMEVP